MQAFIVFIALNGSPTAAFGISGSTISTIAWFYLYRSLDRKTRIKM